MITINDIPEKYTPAFNPVVYRIVSSAAGTAGFKYVVDIRDINGTVLATAKYQPPVDPSTPIDIDVQRYLQDLINSAYCHLNVTQTDVVEDTNIAAAPYFIDFSEQMGTGSGQVVSGTVTQSGYVFNAALSITRFAFFTSGTVVRKWLHRFKRHTVKRTESLQLFFLQDALLTPINIRAFNSAGVQVASGNLANPVSEPVITVNAGWERIVTELSFSPSVYESAAWYTLALPGGETFTVHIMDFCGKFPGTRLYFLNELGGFDGFTFLQSNVQTISTDKKSYQRQPANKRAAYSTTDRRFEALKRNFSTSYMQKMKLTSNWLTDDEAIMLVELISSPLVYMEMDFSEFGGPARTLVPIDIEMNTYSLRSAKVDKLFTVDLDVSISFNNFRQSL